MQDGEVENGVRYLFVYALRVASARLKAFCEAKS